MIHIRIWTNWREAEDLRDQTRKKEEAGQLHLVAVTVAIVLRRPNGVVDLTEPGLCAMLVVCVCPPDLFFNLL